MQNNIRHIDMDYLFILISSLLAEFIHDSYLQCRWFSGTEMLFGQTGASNCCSAVPHRRLHVDMPGSLAREPANLSVGCMIDIERCRLLQIESIFMGNK